MAGGADFGGTVVFFRFPIAADYSKAGLEENNDILRIIKVKPSQPHHERFDSIIAVAVGESPLVVHFEMRKRIMRKQLLLGTFVMIAFMLFQSAGLAKDAAFDAFWAKFQVALKNNDKEAIASMTRLPYVLDSQKMDKKAFIVYCDKLFSKKTRACLVKEKPVKDQTSFLAFCGDDIFIFEKVNGVWMFTEVGVND